MEDELDDCEQEEGNEQHQQQPDFNEVAAHHQDQILSAEADQRSESSPFLSIDHHFVSPTPSTCSSGTGGKSAKKRHSLTSTPSFSMENFV